MPTPLRRSNNGFKQTQHSNCICARRSCSLLSTVSIRHSTHSLSITSTLHAYSFPTSMSLRHCSHTSCRAIARLTNCFILSSNNISTRLHATNPPLMTLCSKKLRITSLLLVHFISSSLTLSLPSGSLTTSSSCSRICHPHASLIVFNATA